MKPYNIKGKGRHYKSPNTGEDLPSVTNILDCYPKHHALVHWAANQQKQLDVAAAYELYKSTAKFKDAEHFRQVLDDTIGRQRKHIKDLRKAQNIGSRVHAAIEAHIKQTMGLPFDDESITTLDDSALWAYMAWQDWWKELDIEPLDIERFVFSDFYGFAGTTDLLAKVRLSDELLERLNTTLIDFGTFKLFWDACQDEPLNMVIDFKTGKGIYPDMLLQLSAYIGGLIEMDATPSDTWGMIVRLPKVVEDPEFEIRFLTPHDRVAKFKTFLAVKTIWEDKVNG